jgi:hypothetical protein
MTPQREPAHRGPPRDHRSAADPPPAPDPLLTFDSRPTSELTRREFVTRAALVAGAGVIAPFSFVRAASARTDELEQYLHRKLVEANTPGIAVAVVRGDEIVWSAGVGWADRERRIRATRNSVFQLASVSKTVTCAGIMALVEDGLIDLDADVNTYLPFEVHIPHAPDIPITMRTILTHTSAIRDRWQVWGTPWSKHPVLPRGLADLARRLLPLVLLPRRKPVPAPQELLRASAGGRVRVFESRGRAGGLRGRGCERGRLQRPVQATRLRTARDDGHRVPARRYRHLEPRDAVRHRVERRPRADLPLRLPRLSGRGPSNERSSPGEMARRLHELRGLREHQGARRTNGARDQAQPDPRSRPLASRPDLVRAEAMGLPRDGTHRRRLCRARGCSSGPTAA